MKEFVHLRVHSAYSLSEGASHVKAYLSAAKAHGQPAFALTDRDNLFDAMNFSEYATAAGIQPIVGCDLRLSIGDGKLGSFTLLAQTEAGLRQPLRPGTERVVAQGGRGRGGRRPDRPLRVPRCPGGTLRRPHPADGSPEGRPPPFPHPPLRGACGRDLRVASVRVLRPPLRRDMPFGGRGRGGIGHRDGTPGPRLRQALPTGFLRGRRRAVGGSAGRHERRLVRDRGPSRAMAAPEGHIGKDPGDDHRGPYREPRPRTPPPARHRGDEGAVRRPSRGIRERSQRGAAVRVQGRQAQADPAAVRVRG